MKSQTAVDFMGAMGLAKNFELGLVVPLSFQSGDPAPKIGFSNSVSSFALGDIRLIPKYRIVEKDKLGIAISVPLIIPSGSPSAFTGGGFGVQPRLAVDYALPNDFRFLANAGLTFRQDHTIQNLTVGNDFQWGAGAEIPVKVEGRDLAVLASIVGAVQLKGEGQAGAPIEILVAGRYRMRPELALTVGAGRGITSGFGTPDFRILAGLVWGEREQPVAKNEEPSKPVCAYGPEDFDGFQDDDGC
ncbi:MAG: transporter, partial [Myxococcaceae bacterium]